MTLLELQKKLGEQIEYLTSNNDLKKADYEKAWIICNLAKQMINNADILIRYSKLTLENSSMEEMICLKEDGNKKI